MVRSDRPSRRELLATNQDITDRIWKIVEKVGVCMLTTQFHGGMRARPLEARPDRNQNLIFFVTDARSAKDDEVQAAPDVGVVFIDQKANAFLSITGRAQVLTGADKASAIWRKTDDVWWPDGPTDANVRVLKVTWTWVIDRPERRQASLVATGSFRLGRSNMRRSEMR
jgi:general stress protein 26